ncbi:Hypothetical protein NGAL_HAMBI2427_54810 [Neorhizobium galegae bv. orientalis]|uniref:Uncharacterized protein n=2 Tax=Neorhizobium galegae TaxID=399 RepID=A0A068T1V1_NEOGA|nr:Hypothetical protein RG540_PA07940 [Neorhizobium galegae bv. orientalis str. HAMBI 540]CDZ54109.1 Hypothetical protein NGAL_HAMBI2427_54810 [Neorhizobium galegae bv. orientalis]
MACSDLQIDMEAELVALARLVIYAREIAKGLKSIEVEAGLSVTLEAITKELTGDLDVTAARHSRKTPSQTYQ